jgi:fucose permease
MNGSFIGKKEINDFLTTLDNPNENSIFKYGSDDLKNSSQKTIDTEEIKTEVTVTESPYRFVIVFLFSMLSFSNGIQWVFVSAVAQKFQDTYGLNKFETDLFSMIFMIVYPIVTFPSSYVIDNVSIRMGVIFYYKNS